MIVPGLLQTVALQLGALEHFVPILGHDNFVREVGRFDKTDGDRDVAPASLNDAFLMRDEEHAALEEVGLDKRELLELLKGQRMQ